MKVFQDIVTAIGLSPSTTVVRAGLAGSIVYEAVLDSGKATVTGIKIDVDRKLQGYLDETTWNSGGNGSGNGVGVKAANLAPGETKGAQGTAPPGSSPGESVEDESGPTPDNGAGNGSDKVLDAAVKEDQPSSSELGPTIRLSAVQAAMNVGECRFSVACRWDLVVEYCGSDGMELVFANDSDQVTTWVGKMAYLMMNDFQDYLL